MKNLIAEKKRNLQHLRSEINDIESRKSIVYLNYKSSMESSDYQIISCEDKIKSLEDAIKILEAHNG
jgi:hypothetical protein